MLKAKLDRKDLLQENRYSRFQKVDPFQGGVMQQAKKKVLWDEDDGSNSDNDNGSVADGYFSATSSEDDKPVRAKKASSFKKYEQDDLDEELFNYFRKSYWKNSDIDLFIYGLDEKEAEKKIFYLFELFKKNIKNIPHFAKPENANDSNKFNKLTKKSKKYSSPKSTEEGTNYDDILLIRTENAITFKFISSVRTVQVILRIYKSPVSLCNF